MRLTEVRREDRRACATQRASRGLTIEGPSGEGYVMRLFTEVRREDRADRARPAGGPSRWE